MTDREEISTALSMLMDTIMSLLQEDPHSWSTRPCGTCRTISGIVGRPFGCYEYQRKNKKRHEEENNRNNKQHCQGWKAIKEIDRKDRRK